MTMKWFQSSFKISFLSTEPHLEVRFTAGKSKTTSKRIIEDLLWNEVLLISHRNAGGRRSTTNDLPETSEALLVGVTYINELKKTKHLQHVHLNIILGFFRFLHNIYSDWKCFTWFVFHTGRWSVARHLPPSVLMYVYLLLCNNSIQNWQWLKV